MSYERFSRTADFFLREFSAALFFSGNCFGFFGEPEIFWDTVYQNRTTQRYSEVSYYDLDSLTGQEGNMD